MLIHDVTLFCRFLVCYLPIDPLHHLPSRLCIVKTTDNAAVAVNLPLFMLDVRLRPLALPSIRVRVHKDILVVSEESVDIFKSSVGGFRVEEIDDGDETEIEDGPDDIELPMQALDPNRRDLDDHEVDNPVRGSA